MAIAQTDRPRFYEQQYLGSRDLTAVVDYGRLARARHDLGAHSWGIAAGLQLVEKPSKTGLDVFVQPGYAWDGFGRPIVVLAPFKISSELFKSIAYVAGDDANTPAGHLEDVWIAYTATPRGGPPYGFEACAVDDQYSRLFESYRVVIGSKPAHADRHDPITIGTKTDDAAKALQMVGSATDPLLEDESVPHQTFPEGWDSATWLVPIGAVRWLPPKDALTPGGFVKREPADLTLSDRKRRYVGVVAETVDAARGFIRLRDRTKPYAPTVWSDDLVWSEGSLRVSGDVKLLRGQLILRDENNTDAGRPLAVRRRQLNTMAPPGSDLFVQIGDAETGSNRFVVGPVLAPANPTDPETFLEKLVVRDNGTVGIGTPLPTWPLTIRGQGAKEELIGFESGAGQVSWHVNQLVDGKSGLNVAEGAVDGRLYVQSGGNVGIGTTDPKHRLEVHGEDNGIVLISTAAAGNARNAGLELRTTAADGVSYIDFVKGSTDLIGSGVPDFGGRLSYNEANTGDFAVRGARLGLGTLTPSHLLHVASASGLRQNRLYVTGGLPTNDHWSSLSYNAYHNDANDAWVFPDPSRKAVTIEMDDTGGVPRFQVWSTTTANTQGWVQRLAINGDNGFINMGHTGGKVAIGPAAAATCKLHVTDTIAGADNQIPSHVALIENLAPANGDVLALRIGGLEFNANNFITFFRGSNVAVGSVEGHQTLSGVVFNTSGADYAEWLPRADGERPMEPGDVVGVVEGRVSRRTAGAERVMAISTAPAVLGNMPAREERERYEQVVFVGQAPVKVRGVVKSGDYLVARDEGDGAAVAVSPDDMTLDDFARVVGVAWESARDTGVRKVRAALGLPATHAWRAVKAMLEAVRAEPSGARRERAGSRRRSDS